jgi:hypothetical protein
MAVIKANYVTRGKAERATAKANIRYIQERPGRDREKLTRSLFGNAGFIGRHETYQFIDDAAKEGRYFYRFKFSPDPATEDIKRDLHMQKLTRYLMRRLEKRLKTRIPWAGAVHDDHTDIRHVHILAALPRRLKTYELEALIREATYLCRDQRRELDFGKDRTKIREGINRQRFDAVVLRGQNSGMHPRDRGGVNFSKNKAPLHHEKQPYLTVNPQIYKTPHVRGMRGVRFHSCTCPRCHFSQAHASHGAHGCISCGHMLHKKREPTLERKGRAWERSI